MRLDLVNRATVGTAGRLSALGTVLLVVASCTTAADQAMQADLIRLEQRVAELDLSNSRHQTQINQLDEDVLLLEDRVEAHRLSLERRGVMATRTRSELPAYQPPTVEPDYAYMTELPVQRLAPASQTYAAQPGAPLEEIVITNDTLERFVQENGGPPVVRTASSGQAGGQSPYEPVVLGDRLPPAGQPSERQASQASQPREDDTLEIYQSSLQQFNAGNYGAALSGFETFLAVHPEQGYADNAYYWIGECHYARGDYSAALGSFERVVQDFPNGNKVPDSLLKIGLTYVQLENREEANEGGFDFVERDLVGSVRKGFFGIDVCFHKYTVDACGDSRSGEHGSEFAIASCGAAKYNPVARTITFDGFPHPKRPGTVAVPG